MLNNKYFDAVVNALDTIELHDYMVDRIALSNDVMQNVKSEIDTKEDEFFLFGAKILSTDGIGHVKVFAKDANFMNELFMKDKYDRNVFHNPKKPLCSICKEKYKNHPSHKSTMSDIEAQLYPKCSSDEGFLAPNERLKDVVDADAAVLQKSGITYQQIADRLKYVERRAKYLAWKYQRDNEKEIDKMHKENEHFSIYDLVKKGFIVDSLRVSWDSYMGYQNCPFECKGNRDEILSDTDFTICNINLNKSIFCSELHPHLIKEHEFFEGNTKYRLDPTLAIEVLDIKQGVDYSFELGTENFWTLNQSSSGGRYTLKQLLAEALKNSEMKTIIDKGQVLDLGDGICCYLFEEKLFIMSDISYENAKYLDTEIESVSFVERICGPCTSVYRKASFDYPMERK